MVGLRQWLDESGQLSSRFGRLRAGPIYGAVLLALKTRKKYGAQLPHSSRLRLGLAIAAPVRLAWVPRVRIHALVTV